MTEWLTIAGLVTLGVAGFLRYGDVMYPPVLHCAVWALVLALGSLFGGALDPVPTSVLILIALSGLTFSAGAYAATYTLGREQVWSPPAGAAPHAGFTHLLTLVSAAGLPFFLLRVLALGAEGPTESTLVNARLAMTGDVFSGLEATGSLGLVEYLVPLATMAAVLELARARRFDRWALVAVLVAGAYAVLFTGRTVAVQLLVAVMGLRLIRREIAPGRGALFAIGAFVAVFAGVGFALGKLGIDGVIDLGDILLSYTVASLRALGQVIATDPIPTGGENVFRTVLAALARFGAEVGAPSLVKEPAYVPIPTNVYTVFHPYLLDFGLIGTVVLPWLLGLFHGALYRGAVRRGGALAVVFAFMLYPLAMQVFQDQYVSLLSQWVQLGALLFVAYWLPGAVEAARRTRRYFQRDEERIA